MRSSSMGSDGLHSSDIALFSTGFHILLLKDRAKFKNVSSFTSSSITSRRAQRYTGPFGSLVALFESNYYDRRNRIRDLECCKNWNAHLQSTPYYLIDILPAPYLTRIAHILAYDRSLVGNVYPHQYLHINQRELQFK